MRFIELYLYTVATETHSTMLLQAINIYRRCLIAHNNFWQVYCNAPEGCCTLCWKHTCWQSSMQILLVFVGNITMFSTLNTFTVYAFFFWDRCQKECMQLWECTGYAWHLKTKIAHNYYISLVASFQLCILANTLLTKMTTDPDGCMSQLHLLDITLSRPFRSLFWSEGRFT